MPNITIDGPPLKDIESKRKLIELMTEAASEVYGIRKEAFVVLIRENTPDNVGIGGKLLVDRTK